MRKLLIIGDSLSMSRYEEGVLYEDMYSSRLSIAFPERLIVNASERSNTTSRICSPSFLDEYVYPMTPDVVVIQLGVVDCLPRILTDFQRLAVSFARRSKITKGIAEKYVACLSRQRFQITKKRPMSLVSREHFEKNLRTIESVLIKGNLKVKFIVIDIPCPTSSFNERSYGADHFVQEYNRILRNVFCSENSRFVSLYEITKCNRSLLLSDGYHINRDCHDLLFKSVKVLLDEWGF